ncbi:MAG TPA: heme ABC transporter ATP-binding protein [Pseudomonas xinjiangensis]|uniref:Heme ABC transporter ATP-binding protein n=2 Tax=root TaxID=1 RepID=A0A7V1BNG1_9GAMM|nr:heme ABC transporter ATP-binding protein [Halopseudomonas xinjiangensis]HEC46453.1 heme ABC transporter ATP-binding protein [Halopseudomonas xinjiangensis]
MLEAKALACARGGETVLTGVDLTLAAGEMVAILGTNGAGKSTLLATLSGELPPSAGEVLLAGRPISAWPSQERARRLAVLPQSSSLAFGFSVEEVVAMGRLPHQEGLARDRKVIAEALHASDVTHLAKRSYLRLSGGEKQRVHLARVMAQIESGSGRSCLLLDEPTASLDLMHQQLILQRACDIAAAGGAVLVVLHDLNLAARYADRIMLLDQGRVSACGSPWQVLEADRIQQVFGVTVQVERHPLHDAPLIII